MIRMEKYKLLAIFTSKWTGEGTSLLAYSAIYSNNADKIH